MVSINAASPETERLDGKTLQISFEKWWPDLEQKLTEFGLEMDDKEEQSYRPADDVLDEILTLTRTVARKMAVITHPLSTPRQQSLPLSSTEPVPGPRILDPVIGEHLSHRKFGIGVVRDLIGDGDTAEMIIDFKSVGQKRLLIAWSPLRRLPLVEIGDDGEYPDVDFGDDVTDDAE